MTKPSAVDLFENAATRAARRHHDALNTRDWQAFVANVSPTYAYSDRRSGTATDYTGDDALSAHRIAFDLDEVRTERQFIATRGESLAVYGTLTTIRDGAFGLSEIECLVLVETDAQGRIATQLMFDNDDIIGVLDELDARYVALGGLDLRTPRHAFNTRDWDLYATFFPEDASVDDRRTAGYGQLDRDGFVAYERAMLEMAPDLTLRVDHVIAQSTATLVVGAITGTQDDGPFEMPYISLSQSAPDGRTTAITLFDIDDLNDARAEYDRLTKPLVVDLFENAATRASQQQEDISNAQDWQAFVASVSPNFSWHDRRSGLALDCTGEEALSIVRLSFELDEFRLDLQLVATRGEALALHRATTRVRDGASGPSEIECLAVYETDANGRLAAQVIFDAADITGALDELDTRDVAHGGNPLGATFRHAVTARDWETLRSLMTPDCTFADYRTAGWGLTTRDAFVDYQRSVGELSPDTQLWADHTRSRGNVYISAGRAFGTRTGGPWEIAYVTIGVCRTDYRTTHVENYELSDMARAQERFAELVVAETAAPVANLAWQAAEQQATSVAAQNWESYLAHTRAGLRR